MNRDELQSLLQQPYDRATWRGLLVDVFPHVSLYQTPQRPPDGTPDYVNDYAQIGSVRLADGKNLALFEVKVSDKVNLLKNRIGLRHLVAKHIDQATTHGVLCVFNSTSDEYRFTFVSKETSFDEEGQIVTTQTTPKRYTYILGPGETRRTAAERFSELAAKRDTACLKQVTEAFSVERLNKEFFRHYKEHYERFVEHLLNTVTPATVFGVESAPGTASYELDCKPIRDFVKRLLGRIVFLHFIQKKGWLGCDADSTDWVGGDPNFLKNLFVATVDQNRYHSDTLVPLFFEALNCPGRENDIFDLTGNRVPYLNGGLFEEILRPARKINFPAQYFSALLDFLGSYNFTIDENDPEEHEVGIDPEMLGHIFENLLEENKDKGAYYTPKPIVQFMCKESILHYLENHLGKHISLTNFVRSRDAGDADDSENWIQANASRIEELLDNVKVCDPAIGSGAFPIGILQELFWLKLTLDWTLNDPAKLAEIKRRIIQNSIYGVDIDAGAIEIARLRFWLALVVDEIEPRPLPNLDYKIMQGDSLLESYAGVDLSSLVSPATETSTLVEGQQELNLSYANKQLELIEEERSAEITSLIEEYFQVSDPIRKQEIHKLIDGVARNHIEYNIEREKKKLENELSRHQNDIKRKLEQAPGWIPPARTARKIGSLRTEILTLEDKRRELLTLEDSWERPYFLWKLFFKDVVGRKSFDIVIANPPYIKSSAIPNKPQLEPYYKTYQAKSDIYVYFYELGIRLLSERGVLCYITSNQFFRAEYGDKLRNIALEQLRVRRIVDVSTANVFKAAAYPAIVIADKLCREKNRAWSALSWEELGNPEVSKFSSFVSDSHQLPSNYLSVERWLPISSKKIEFLNHLLTKYPPLEDQFGSKMFRGVITGYNTAFIVPRSVRDEICASDPMSHEIIHPILSGPALHRWTQDDEDTFIIFSRHGIDIDHYPAVKEHLQKYRHRLEPTGSANGGRKKGSYKWYEIQDTTVYARYFEEPKIAWGNLAQSPSFSLVAEGVYLNTPSPFIASRSKYLLGILNSSVTHFVIHYTAAVRRGGYREYKPTFVNHVPIPDPEPSVKEAVEAAVSSCLHDPAPENDIRLNKAIYRAFGLSDAQALILENFTELHQHLITRGDS